MYSSNTTRALVPPMPKELTPALLGNTVPCESPTVPRWSSPERYKTACRSTRYKGSAHGNGPSRHILQRQYHLQQSGDPAAAQMADIGFYRTQAAVERILSPRSAGHASCKRFFKPSTSIGSPSLVPYRALRYSRSPLARYWPGDKPRLKAGPGPPDWARSGYWYIRRDLPPGR